MSPNAGGRGWGVAGCGVSANEYSCAHGAQINLADLTPYLTYARNKSGPLSEFSGLFPAVDKGDMHGPVKLYSHESKMSSSKKLTCKGTLRQVFIRVYRMEKQTVMLVFSSQLCEPLPL
jgi:hypothetical protein